MTGAPDCRLYLEAPPGLDAAALTGALDAGDVACVLLRSAGLEAGGLVPAIDRLRPIAQDHGAAFLLENQIDLAAESGCDGVHLAGGESLAAACRRFGADGIVGVHSGESLDLAMGAGEAGADYIAFGAAPDLLAWWRDVMTLPCVAMGEVTLAQVGGLSSAGADFVALGQAVWDHPDGPAAAVRSALAAIGHSRV